MEFNYTISNNTCYENNDGSIIINDIQFDSQSELNQYSSYSVSWSGYPSLSTSQISNDGTTITNLVSGIYSFKIISLSSNNQTPWENITITSPEKLEITEVSYKPASCDNDSFIKIYISGGTPPYIYSINGISNTTSETNVSFTGLDDGEYTLSVIDNNNCTDTYNKTISIEGKEILYSFINIIPPLMLNSYAQSVQFSINGNGPFDIGFANESGETAYHISALDTTDLENISNDTYRYNIKDKLYPGSYSLRIIDTNNCFQIFQIDIPNILPMAANISVIQDSNVNQYNPIITRDIFDTLLIPYKNITENNLLWQSIAKYNLRDFIYFNINGERFEFRIIRNILDKYCIEENKIEILRLGNDSKDWFFYLHLAPSLDPSSRPDLLISKIELIDGDNKFPILLGLDSTGNLDTENPSLIKGSFIINGITLQGTSKPSIIAINFDSENLENYNFTIKDPIIKTYKNTYQLGIVTGIEFLHKFEILNQYVNIGQTTCNTDIDTLNYISNIKNLLIAINNFNNLSSVYIYSLDSQHSGQLNILLTGNSYFITENGDLNNSYNIEYLGFNDKEESFKKFHINNNIIKDINTISGLPDMFIIAKISDKYNNKVNTIINDIFTFSYDDHYIDAKQLLEKNYSWTLDNFHYGDILIYIPYFNYNYSALSTNIPTASRFRPLINIFSDSSPKLNIISQTSDTINTGKLNIEIFPIDTKCVLFGPKNYIKEFTGSTIFTNLVEGVYVIKGQDEDLYNKKLIQKDYRIVITKGLEQSIQLGFDNYNNITIIKDA